MDTNHVVVRTVLEHVQGVSLLRRRRSGTLLISWYRRRQCMGRSLRLFKCTESLRLRLNIMRGSTKHVVLPKAARLHPWMWSRPIWVQAVLRTSFLEGLFAGIGFFDLTLGLSRQIEGLGVNRSQSQSWVVARGSPVVRYHEERDQTVPCRDSYRCRYARGSSAGVGRAGGPYATHRSPWCGDLTKA